MLRRQTRLLSNTATKLLHSRNGKSLSELSNGLKVLTFDDTSGASGIGFFTLAGPSWENDATYGCSNILEALPLKSNAIIQQPQLSQTIGTFGNAVKMQNHKECLSYLLMAPRYHLKEAVQTLGAIALYPTQDEKVFEEAKEQTKMLSEFFARDATRCCFEYIHQAAWSGAGLGLPLIQTPEVLSKIDMDTLQAYHKKFVRPERSCLVATGIKDHDEFLRIVEGEFIFNNENVAGPKEGEFKSVPFTGGEKLVHNMEAPDSVKKFAEHNHTHIGLCYKGVPMSHPDYYAYSVIQTLMGGGTSFSSGGPGKGMQTKLFREVINKQGWIHGIECVTAWYRDCGLVGLYGQVEHQWAQQLIAVMCEQLGSIDKRIDNFHWEMSKNQLLAQLVLLTENRELLLEEAGKSLLLGDHVLHSEELIEGTDKLTLEDLSRVCADMKKEPVVYTVYGNTEKIPPFNVVQRVVSQ